MAISPDPIPFTGVNVAPTTFQPGAYAEIAAQNNARVPTGMEVAKFVQGGMNDALTNYLRGQSLNLQGKELGLRQQELNQRAPLYAAQTREAELGNYWKEPISIGQQPPSATLSGVSPFAPDPSKPDSFGGIGAGPNQNMSMGAPATGSPAPGIGPSAGPGAMPDPFAHMHMNPSQPFALGGGAPSMGQQIQGAAPSLMVPRSDVMGMAQTEASRGSWGRILKQSPLVNKYLGDLSGMSDEEAGRLGDPAPLLGKLAEMESSSNYRNANLGMQGARLKLETTGKPIDDGKALYNEFVKVDTSVKAAQKALTDSQKNTALFNTALFNVGKALGVTSRNPEMVIQAISAGDPSLGGQVEDWFAKKGAGKITPQLMQGLSGMMNDLASSNRSEFEQKAMASAQQYADRFGGIEGAKKAMFPGYSWGNQAGGPAPAGQGSQPAQTIRVKRKSDGMTGTINASDFDPKRYDQI